MIYVRADANASIGSGHVMRCLTIAEELRRMGEEVTFLIADEASAEQVKIRCFPFMILHTSWEKLDHEVPLLKEIISQYNIERLLIDSYYISKEALQELSKHTKVMYMDDNAKEVIDVQCVVHYGLTYDNQFFCGYIDNTGRNNTTKLLLGSDYIPLRREFQEIMFQEETRANNILITTGGCDTYNVTGALLKFAVNNRMFDKYHFHIIIGVYNEHKVEIAFLAKDKPNISIYYNINNMSEIMKNSAIAISAGGSSLYELCATRTPTVCFSFADNQKSGTKNLSQLGFVLDAGDVRADVELSVVEIMNNVDKLIEDKKLKAKMVEKMKDAIDGKGALRIAQVLRTL